jgi:hypothetical protein
MSFARVNKDVDGRDKPGHDTNATVSLGGGWYNSLFERAIHV